MNLLFAQIISSHGKTYTVECATGIPLIATTRGKKTDFACGDWVNIQQLNQTQAVIESLHPRKTLLYRSDTFRSKSIAANVSQMLIVIASTPSFNDELIARCLIAAAEANIKPLILFNKTDLPNAIAAREKLHLYEKLGYRIVALSAHQDISSLYPILEGETSVLVGQSGMGKSTIINALLPHANARVNTISQVLDSGKHTTTHAALYHINPQSHLIDAPGLQQFGLSHIPKNQMIQYMPDLAPYIGECRFHNCHHLSEPNCAIQNAVEKNLIVPARLNLLFKLQEASKQNK